MKPERRGKKKANIKWKEGEMIILKDPDQKAQSNRMYMRYTNCYRNLKILNSSHVCFQHFNIEEVFLKW